MKKIFTFGFVLFSTLIAQSSFATTLNQDILVSTIRNTSPADLINWKVGDGMDYEVASEQFGNMGTLNKSVTSEEGGAIWVKQSMAVLGQNEVVEALIRRADGEILKMLRNGKEVDVPNDTIEIIEQEVTTIELDGLGKFDCIHVVAKSTQIERFELWANPQATVMDGTLKQLIPTSFLTLEIVLKAFRHGK